MSKTKKKEKRRPERQEERKVSRCWNKSCLIRSKNFNTNAPNISTEWNSIRQNKKKSMKFDAVQEFWIHLIKFDATTRKLNRQYDIELTVTKIRFFHNTLPRNAIRTTGTRFLVSISLLTLFRLCYMTVMTLLWWMGVAKRRYQFISSSWGFLSMITPWFVSNIGNTSIRI